MKTYDDFIRESCKSSKELGFPPSKEGNKLWWLLDELNPGLALEVMLTRNCSLKIDPFGNDSNILAFYKFIEENWDKYY